MVRARREPCTGRSAMESNARAAAAPPKSRKRRERARTVRALHRTTKAAPSSHAASADRRAAAGGGGGGSGAGGGDGDAGTSSFFGLIREDGEHRRRRREAGGAHHPPGSSSSSSSFADPSSSPDGLVGAAIVVDGVVDLDVRLVAEVRRASLVKSLRRTLQSSCEEAGIVAPIYTWERWQSRCKLHELLHPSPSPSTASDEVLPCTGHVDAGCVADLVRGGCDPAAAAAIATDLGLAAARAAAELAAFTASLSSSPPVPVRDGGAAGSTGKGDGTDDGRDKDDSVRGNGSVEDGAAEGMSNRQRKRIKLQQQKAMRSAAAACGGQKRQRSSLLEEEVARHAVQVRSHRHSVDFSVLSGGKKLFKLNHGHYEKLRLLVAASCGGSVGGDPPGAGGGGGVVRVSESDFHKLVYCVLSRYHSVLGHGFQMALGEQAFDVLRAWFDVRFECFASPLNCTCGSYASAFPLADRCFGAVGNFFSLRPSVGSFEANPPFIAEVMSAMVDHMHELLRDATGPMSFVVIVPGWLEDPAWMALSASPFKRAFFLVAAADHGFCDGAQHQRQDR